MAPTNLVCLTALYQRLGSIGVNLPSSTAIPTDLLGSESRQFLGDSKRNSRDPGCRPGSCLGVKLGPPCPSRKSFWTRKFHTRSAVEPGGKSPSKRKSSKNGTLLKDFDLCDELNKEVLFPSEAVVELAAQSNLHGYADQAIRGLARAVDITPNEFLGGIKEYIADCEDGITAIDWKQIGKCAAPFLASAPSPTFFAGSLMHQVQQKPSRQKKKRRIQDDAGEVVNPTQ
eukprot:1330649-Amorphochlora_amoeboformis.AAC.1